jgi:hypothetical protein
MKPETRFRREQPVVGRVDPCRFVDLAEHADHRGRLTVVQPRQDVDFDMRWASTFTMSRTGLSAARTAIGGSAS